MDKFSGRQEVSCHQLQGWEDSGASKQSAFCLTLDFFFLLLKSRNLLFRTVTPKYFINPIFLSLSRTVWWVPVLKGTFWCLCSIKKNAESKYAVFPLSHNFHLNLGCSDQIKEDKNFYLWSLITAIYYTQSYNVGFADILYICFKGGRQASVLTSKHLIIPSLRNVLMQPSTFKWKCL